jgi:uncharacterized caspase-like protein
MNKLFTSIILILIFIHTSLFGQSSIQGAKENSEKRIALVIGNGTYLSGRLANPENDAETIADVLIKLGFEVYKYFNLNQSQMKRAIDEFGLKLKGNDAGLFFYAGHGIQAKGFNYLIPVDAELKTEDQVDYDCVRADRVLSLMETSGTKINIVILDACRNNPFERSWTRNANGKGLATMNAPRGTLIAYSTSPGSTAADGIGKNSPYTSALLSSIQIPNITIMQVFQIVRNMVIQKSQNQQMPWESTSLTGDFYFKQTVSTASNVTSQPVNTENLAHSDKSGRTYDFSESKNDWKAEGLGPYIRKQTIKTYYQDTKKYSFGTTSNFDESGNIITKSYDFSPGTHIAGVFTMGSDASVFNIYDSQTNKLKMSNKIYEVNDFLINRVEPKIVLTDNYCMFDVNLLNGLIKTKDTIFYESNREVKASIHTAEVWERNYINDKNVVFKTEYDTLFIRYIVTYKYGRNGLIMSESANGFDIKINKRTAESLQESYSKRKLKKTPVVSPEPHWRDYYVNYVYTKFDEKGNWTYRDFTKGSDYRSGSFDGFQTAEYEYYDR